MTAPGISLLHLARGRLCVQAVAPPAGQPFHVEAGGLELPLEPMPAGQAPQIAPPVLLSKALGSGFELRINHSRDWMVPGLDTAQLRLIDRTTRRSLPLGKPVSLPAGSGPLELRAALAAHRAQGLLTARITYPESKPEDAPGSSPETPPDSSPDSSPEDRISVAFDLACRGGKTLSGYQHIALPLPPATGPREVSLWVEYRQPTEPLSKHDPYLFVCWPRLVPGGDTEAAPVEPVLIRQTPQDEARWYVADIPPAALPAGAELAVLCGSARQTVLTVPRIGLRMLHDRGHQIGLQAMTPPEAPLEVVAWIDGQPAFGLRLDAEAQTVRLPARHLTGSPGLFELRDPSGTAVLFATWILRRDIATSPQTLQRAANPPHAPRLFAQSEARFRGLRAHLAAGADAATAQQLGRIIDALEAGPPATAAEPGGLDTLLPLSFPEEDAPEVSVVIPAHNHLGMTHACLAALRLAHCRSRYEVILVDDGSTDDTARIEQRVSGIRVLRNPAPLRFLRAVNAAVAQARAPHVVLLNNDTEPTAGWLDALRDAFDRFDRVGLAGARLLNPDGTLQEAGGIVWNNGRPWRYAGQSPSDPRVSYARQVDYVSGAALMVSRAAWDAVGGFSDEYAPMYFEDTDLAFKLREAGYTTWYIPEAAVFHHEGVTSGTEADPTAGAGLKRHQAINAPRFRRRWAGVLAGHRPENQHPDLEKDRGIIGRVLFIDAAIPRPDRDAGSFAALQEIRLVQSLGYKVTFLPDNLGYLSGYVEDLQRIGVEVVTAPFVLSPQAFIEERGREFDAVYITRYGVAEPVLDTLRSVDPKLPVILNNADLHFLRQMRAALAAGDAERLAAAETVRAQELEVIGKVDLTLSYSPVEAAVIDSFAERPVRVARCPWVVEPPASVPPREGRAGLSFLGSFAHHPNAEGLEWFARSVLPRLAEARPGLVLSVYGASMGPAQRALAGPALRPVGRVAEVTEAYDPHLAFVAPLLAGAGIKGKVIGALAHGIPTVLSPVAAEATGLRDGEDCLIAATPEAWEGAILRLIDDAALWQKLSDNGRAFVTERYSFAKGREAMRAALESVGLFRSLP